MHFLSIKCNTRETCLILRVFTTVALHFGLMKIKFNLYLDISKNIKLICRYVRVYRNSSFYILFYFLPNMDYYYYYFLQGRKKYSCHTLRFFTLRYFTQINKKPSINTYP
jgi:hypothetical protein